MLKNTNQAAVQKLAARSLRQNRVRNLFTILAIILTTFMFTTVFSIGFSLGRNMSIMMLRQQGNKRSICLNQPEKEQIDQVKKAKYLDAAGIQIPIGLAADTSEKTNIRLDYYDKTEFEKNLTPAISNIHGDYPEKVDEIMLSQAGLAALQIDEPKQGMDIVLVMDSVQKTFRLSGWFTDYASSAGGFQGFLSKEYVSSIHKTVEQDGVLSISAVAGKKDLLLEELESKVTLKQEQKLEAFWDVQEENQGNAFVIACAIGLMGLIIVVSGYLLIYNIMYISVTKDIRFYGMLKTIGTSPSQIRKIVRSQIRRLSVIGIPIGIALGSILAFLAVPLALTMFTMDNDGAMPQDVSFNPLIYVGTILFAVITVAVSCRKPAKLAGKISPVEALKYHGQTKDKKKGKKTTDGGKLYKMSFRNVFREKKRAFLVFASLFMGTMAFLSVNTFLGSLKLENYVDVYLPNDFTIYASMDSEEEESDGTQEEGQIEGESHDVQEEETSKEEGDVQEEGQLKGESNDTQEKGQSEENERILYGNQLIEDLGKIEGITEMSVNRTADLVLEFDVEVFRPFLERGLTNGTSMQDMIDYYTRNADDKEEAYSAPVISVSSAMMKKYNEQAKQKIDISRFEKGEICLMGDVPTQEEAEKVRGKEITLTDLDTGKTLSLEVGACPTYGESNGLNVGYTWQRGGGPSCILISDAAMEKICDKPSVNSIIIDCDPKAESRVKSRIKNLTRINPCVLHTEIKSDLTSEFKSSMMAMNILGSGISLVLILIGIINFINVMFTGVFARRGELAVMESVGMTKKQVKKMLVYEGVYYGGITIALLLTLGNALMYLIAHFAQQIADYAVFYYPVTGMCILSVAIMVICMFVPVVVYQMFARESVTERLRRSV